MNTLLKEIEEVRDILEQIREREDRKPDHRIPEPVRLRLEDVAIRARELHAEIDRQQRNQYLAAKGATLIPPTP